MSSVYLSCLVIGGGLAIVSALGELAARVGSGRGRSGPVYALRALVYSLTAFGATGVLLERLEPGLGTGLTLAFAILAALSVGGLAGTVLSLLGRAGPGDLNGTPGGNRS
jgi:hypothetical protein